MNTSEIRHAIKEHFQASVVDDVFSVLLGYVEKPRPDFTYYAILRLARGDLGEVHRLVQRAQTEAKAIREEGARAEAWDRMLETYGSHLEHWPWIKPFRGLLARLDATSVRWRYHCSTSHESVIFQPADSAGCGVQERLAALTPLKDGSGMNVELRGAGVTREFPYDARVEDLLAWLEQELD